MTASSASSAFDSAIDLAFCALRDQRAEPEPVFDDEDGPYSDCEPMLACARRTIRAAGLGHVDLEAAASEAVEQYQSLDQELRYLEHLGDTYKPDYRAARAAMLRPTPPTPPTIAPSITSSWRMLGRAPRRATNTRTRGSRRCSASRGDPDDLADPPPADSRSLIGGRR